MKVFNIQRFCVDDGKGIRTTVFFRDCPLRCKWCANPESWAKKEVLDKSGFSVKEMTAKEILTEVLKDKVYYQNSGGGVTLSGGEPLLHIQEVLELLKLLKQENEKMQKLLDSILSWKLNPDLEHMSLIVLLLPFSEHLTILLKPQYH